MVRRMFLVLAVLAIVGVSSACSAGLIPTTGLQAWLTADSITGVSDGGAVATWTNSASTGSAYNATASGTAQPTYVASGIDGKPVVRFNGSNMMLMGATPMQSQANFTMFAVYEDNSATADGTIVANVQAAATGVNNMTGMTLRSTRGIPSLNVNAESVMYDNAGVVQFGSPVFETDPSNNFRSTPTNSAVHGTSRIVTSSWTDGATNPLGIYINGGTPQPITFWNGSFWNGQDWPSNNQYWAATDPGLGIGDSSTPTSKGWAPLNGDIAELIFYNGSMAPSDVNLVGAYLSGKYGIAFTPLATPEPGTLVLFGTGLIGLLAYAWRKRK